MCVCVCFSSPPFFFSVEILFRSAGSSSEADGASVENQREESRREFQGWAGEREREREKSCSNWPLHLNTYGTTW